MYRLFFLIVFVSCFGAAFAQNDGYYKYIENKGQWPSQVLYKCDLESGNLFLEKDGFTYDFWDNSEFSALHGNEDFESIIKNNPPVLKGHVYKVNFINNIFEEKTEENNKLQEYSNYFLGNNESKWAGNCSHFKEVIYKDLYSGIDLKMYSNGFFLKYDFIVEPHANPNEIIAEYSGIDKIKLDNGRLLISLSVNEIVEQKPLAWQFVNGKKQFVSCNYVLNKNQLSYEFPNGYNKNHELIIDPELIFSTYSGSFSDNFGYTATYDNAGYLYSGSSVFGIDYPTTTGAYQEAWGGGVGSGTLAGTDIAITKYDVTGTFRVYSTYLGGEGDELPHSLVVDDNDQLYVYGTTSSPNYPTTTNAFDTTFAGGDSFAPSGVGVDYTEGSDIIVSKFSADGSDLESSTFIGGTQNDGVNTATLLAFNYADEMRGEVLIDSNNDVYIVSSTYSFDFPIVNGFQGIIGGGQEGCIIKMDADLETIIWSSFLGGNSNDAVYAIALDSNNDIYVCGGSESTNLQIPIGAIQTVNNGGDSDGYVMKIAQDGSSILSGTYYGSDVYDQLYFIEVDNDDEVFVYGQTRAPNNTFISNASYSQSNSGMLVSKFNSALSSVEWSTVFGTGTGKPNLSPTAFLIDECSRVYMSGWGGSTNVGSSNGQADYVTGLETTLDAFQDTTDGSDFYLLVIESDASDIIYASFFGGNESSEHVDGGTSRFSPDGTIYQSVCAGCGSNDDFPIYPSNAVSPTNNSPNCNNGVFKMQFDIPTVESGFSAPSTYCNDIPIPFSNQSQFGTEYIWNFGDSSPISTAENPIHEFPGVGTYNVQLITYNDLCDVSDTSYQTVEIITSQVNTIAEAEICENESEIIGPNDINDSYQYEWTPDSYLSNPNVGNPTASPIEEIDYTLVIHHDGCIDTLFQSIDIIHPAIELPADILLCENGTVDLEAIIPSGSSIIWSDFPDLSNILSSVISYTALIDENTTLYGASTLQGCTALDTMTISILGQSVEITPDFTSCANDTISLEVVNPSALLDYYWSPELLILSGQNTASVTTILEQLTEYTVVANYNNECTVSDQVIVNVSGVNSNEINATANPSVILSGEEAQLNALPDGYTYLWTPGESLDNSSSQNPIASPEQTTNYLLTINDGDCSYDVSLKIEVVDFICGNPTIFVPNAFTPNSNDENEKVWVRGNNLTNIYFVIYDRWGEKIFETTDQNLGWDGTYKGEELDPAVFVYYLEAVCADGQEYFEKGNITLIR